MQKFSKQGLMVISLLAFAVMAVSAAAVIPQSRQWIKNLVRPAERTILAKATGFVTVKGPEITVLKIRDQDSISVEVYSAGNSGALQLLQRIPLPESRDGYFNLMGNATNLALADTTHRGILDLLVPTFDEQMTARLHVYRFNHEISRFEPAAGPTEAEDPAPAPQTSTPTSDEH